MILDVLDGERIVGTCRIEREGLYYCIDISCNISDGMFRRIVARTDRGMVSLGIPIPSENGFVIRTKKPCKLFGSGITGIFFIHEGDGKQRAIPVSETKPFEGICRLEHTRFQGKDEYASIILE